MVVPEERHFFFERAWCLHHAQQPELLQALRGRVDGHQATRVQWPLAGGLPIGVLELEEDRERIDRLGRGIDACHLRAQTGQPGQAAITPPGGVAAAAPGALTPPALQPGAGGLPADPRAVDITVAYTLVATGTPGQVDTTVRTGAQRPCRSPSPTSTIAAGRTR